MKKFLFIPCLCLLLFSACSNSNESTASYDAEYQRQLEQYEEQSKIAAEQLKKAAKQQARADLHADRMEKLLER